MIARGDMLVSGFYGNGNLGDEALLLGLLHAIRSADPDLATTIMSDARETTEALCGSSAVQRVHGARRPLFDSRAMLGHRLFALGGGGLVKDYGADPSAARFWLGQLTLARALRRPTMTYAVGVDVLRYAASRRLARRTLRAADLVTVRDRGSAARLRALGVGREVLVTADPAVLVADASPPASSETPVIGVNVREWLSRGPTVERPHMVDRLEAELAAALDALVGATGARVRFVPMRSVALDDDIAACERVAALMQTGGDAEVLAVPSTPDEAVGVLGTCDLVVGMRLHSLVLSAAAGVPVFGLAYMPKVAHFLEHAGLGDQRCDLETGATRGTLTELLDTAWHRREESRAMLGTSTVLMRRLALLNGRLAACLARGDREGLDLARAETLEWAGELEAATAGDQDSGGRPGAPQRTRVAVFPAPFPSNPYHDRLHSELEERGAAVECPAALTPAWARQASRQIDVVHLHWLEHLPPRAAEGPGGLPIAVRRATRTLRALSILRSSGVRVVWTVHNPRPHESSHALIDRLLFRGVAARADALLVHSVHAAERIAGRLCPPSRVWIVPHGNYTGCYPAEPRPREEVRAALGLPASAFVYLIFGHLRAYKHVPETIRAFRALEDPDARLVVAGRPHDEVLRAAVSQAAAGDARVSLHLEHVPDSQVNAYAVAADAVVLGYDEVFSSGALSLALTQGLPAVAPALGSAASLAEGPALETFAPGRLTDALEAVRTGDRDERRLAALAAAARDTWAVAAERTLAAYRAQPQPRRMAPHASSDTAGSR